MNITMGFDPAFRMGNLSIALVQNGISRACRIESQAYANICNVKFIGSTRPNILFRSRSMPNYWAVAYPGSRPGMGTIVYSNHPRVVAAHNDQTLLNLPFHELWHCLAPRPNNKLETVNYPPADWAIALLVRQYGAPTSREEYIPSDTDSMIYQASFIGRWIRWIDEWQQPIVWEMEGRE